jgi:hypothetical protein
MFKGGGAVMKVRIAMVSLFFVLFCFLASNSHADMHKVNLNVWTQAVTGQPDRLCVYVEVFDDQLAHPPDYVKEVRITAPDGSLLYLDPSLHWLAWDKAFYYGFLASEFDSEVIPGGNYTVRVTPDVGSALAESDSVSASFLAPPVVTSPTPEQSGVLEGATFKWNEVPGATYYRIQLWNISWDEPVYYTSFRTKYTDKLKYTIPPGDLKPNCSYRMQIEARAGSQDMDKRSRSAWINFTTGTW